jgi:biotin carboxyl carrier protein
MRRYTLGLGGREFVIDVQELAADRFEVVVGGESYEVTLAGDEDLPEATITPGYAASGAGASPTAPSGAAGATGANGLAGAAGAGGAGTAQPRAARAAAAPAAATVRPRPAPGGSGGAVLSAPMPGVILEVHVKAGDRLERGQPVAVLDAMKMHNVIGAPRAGTVAEVCIAPGQAVGHGDALVRFAQD